MITSCEYELYICVKLFNENNISIYLEDVYILNIK